MERLVMYAEINQRNGTSWIISLSLIQHFTTFQSLTITNDGVEEVTKLQWL